MLTIGVTTMQRAFIASKSVTMKSPLGQQILRIAQRQLEEADKALQMERAIQAEIKRVLATLERHPHEGLSDYLLRISATKAKIRQEMTKG